MIVMWLCIIGVVEWAHSRTTANVSISKVDMLITLVYQKCCAHDAVNWRMLCLYMSVQRLLVLYTLSPPLPPSLQNITRKISVNDLSPKVNSIKSDECPNKTVNVVITFTNHSEHTITFSFNQVCGLTYTVPSCYCMCGLCRRTARRSMNWGRYLSL